MTREVVQMLAKSGLVPEDLLRQLYKWKMVEDVGKVEQPKSAQDLIRRVDLVLEEDGMELVRVTDIDIVNRYLSTQKIGKLVLVADGDTPQSSQVDVAFGRTITGEFIFPWRGDSIADLMTNGMTHLLLEEAEGKQAVYFSDAREAYFGNSKAFMVCAPSTFEQENGHGGAS